MNCPLPVRALALCLAGASLHAASSTAWEMNSWADFLRGKFTGVSLSRDGRLRSGVKSRVLFGDGQSAVWCAAEGPGGEVYLGTGHKGRVMVLRTGQQPRVVFEAPEAEIFAIAADSKGVVYAATSPDGKIYRIEDGKAAEYFNPGERYIWSLAIAPDGTLYAGTGEQGKIYAVKSKGVGEVFYETGQTHVTALAVERGGALLAGSDPNGILYRISAKDKAFVLYDAPLPEIRAIRTAPDGRVYVAALGGSVAKRAASAQNAAGSTGGPVVATSTTTITVEAQAGLDLKPKTDAPKAAPQPIAPAVSNVTDLVGVERSAIYRVSAEGLVETLWSSKEENAYDLLPNGGQLSFSTDGTGRIYGLSDDRKVSLVEQTNQGEVIRLVAGANGMLAIASNPGQVLSLPDAAAVGGNYESPVHDAGATSRWGRLEWSGQGTVQFRTRAGNSARPDRTWSDWSAPMNVSGPIVSPTARFVQWSVEFGSADAAVDSVSVAYRPQNQPPAVRNIGVTAQLAAATQQQAARTTQPAAAAYSITVTDSGETGASTLSGTSTQNAGRSGLRQLTIAWTGEDGDGDTLSYNLFFRGEEERQWKTLRSNLAENSFTLDGDSLADGRYFFRVVASDRGSNPPGDALEGELVSAPVRIDNTPPVVTLVREGNLIVASAVDRTSPLRRCEVSIDARPWSVIEAEDEVTDSREERFKLLLNLSPGEHLVTFRVTDAAGNPGLAKIVVNN